LKFKKAEAMKLGAQALDLRLPFGEIEVLRENTGLIRKQLGLKDNDSLEIKLAEDVDSLEILYAEYDTSLAKAGSLSS